MYNGHLEPFWVKFMEKKLFSMLLSMLLYLPRNHNVRYSSSSILLYKAFLYGNANMPLNAGRQKEFTHKYFERNTDNLAKSILTIISR